MRAVDYVRVRRQWNDFARALGAYFDQYDMYLCPTTAQPPARIGELETPIHLKMAARLMVGLKAGTLALKSGIVDDLAQESLARVPFTQLANLTGTPAMSVPLYWNEQGLPVGVQFGAPMAEKPNSSNWPPSLKRRIRGRRITRKYSFRSGLH